MSDSATTTARPAIAGARRVVVKVGSSSLTTLPGGLDIERLSALVDVLGAARSAGREVVLVSSGAIAAGLAPLGLGGRPRGLAPAQAAPGGGPRAAGAGGPPRPPRRGAGRGGRRPVAAGAALRRRLRPPRGDRRAGAADRRRPHSARALPQRAPDGRAAAHPRGAADRQRE